MPGAMPFLHRWLGQPDVLAASRAGGSARRSTTSIAACAASRATSTTRLDLRCTGMEFATEMIIKASLTRRASPRCRSRCTRMAARRIRRTCSTFRDGWRTLRFFLLYSPRWLFLLPGLALIALGAARLRRGVLPRFTIRGDAALTRTHCSSPASPRSCGYQAVLFAVSAWTFATAEGLMPMTPRLRRWYARINLERGVHPGRARDARGRCAPGGGDPPVAPRQTSAT